MYKIIHIKYIESTKKISKNLTPKVDISGNNFSQVLWDLTGWYLRRIIKEMQRQVLSITHTPSQRKQHRRNEGL